MLPAALQDAIDALPGERFHAVVVDEGQDFARDWLETLDFLLDSPGEDVLWVFHDPGQALYRDDVVGELGLERLEMTRTGATRDPSQRWPAASTAAERRSARSARAACATA